MKTLYCKKCGKPFEFIKKSKDYYKMMNDLYDKSKIIAYENEIAAKNNEIECLKNEINAIDIKFLYFFLTFIIWMDYLLKKYYYFIKLFLIITLN